MSKTFNEAIHEVASELADLVIDKQKDYGKNNILISPFGPEKGIVVRLQDKISRLGHLLQKGGEPANEPIDDTWKDIVGYALIALLVRRGKFELPLEE